VATGKPRSGLERAFEQTGLKQLFDFSRCGDEGFPKPHPDMLLKLMAFAGLNKERVLMIGDTTHDLELAANAGVRSVAVSYGAHPESELRRHEPVKCFQSVDALHTWLTQKRLICKSAALLDGGKAVRFDLPHGHGSAPCFTMRFDGKVFAYVNRCPHRGTELDWNPGEVFDETGLYLICATHGAMFDPQTGLCISGRVKVAGCKRSDRGA